MARYGEGAVDQELPLADKLRRDGDRSGRRSTAVFFPKTVGGRRRVSCGRGAWEGRGGERWTWAPQVVEEGG